MGDEDDVARIVDQMLFEPLDAFGVEMVGRLVEQQDIGLFEQQPRQRDPPFLPARQVGHFAIARRAAQRVHRDLELIVERPAVDRVDFFLKLAHFGHQSVEVAAFGRVAEHHADRVEALHHVGDRADRQHDILLDGLGLVEVRLLLEIADRRPFRRPGLARKFQCRVRP